MKGSTQLSIQPVNVQISQIVTPMGVITISPVRKLDRSEARNPRFGGGGVGGSCMRVLAVSGTSVVI
ncbi:hypothetical protein GCM10023209_11390 [Roseibacterium beibuensis]|uniref:Uncharacterized protein n=1 Tax=[Roseibacterium] beibuensis TaxID=1193142 RepID=A0ABP9L5C9_9RHOB